MDDRACVRPFHDMVNIQNYIYQYLMYFTHSGQRSEVPNSVQFGAVPHVTHIADRERHERPLCQWEQPRDKGAVGEHIS